MVRYLSKTTTSTSKHISGKQHAAPDMLSRRPDADKGEQDNLDLTLLPLELFIRLTIEPSQEWVELEKNIACVQRSNTCNSY